MNKVTIKSPVALAIAALIKSAIASVFIFASARFTSAKSARHSRSSVLSAIVAMGMLVLLTGIGSIPVAAHAAIDVYEFETEQQEAQYRHLIDEFRCPKCQNQNLAGSDSQIAQDLKRKTYEMVVAGQSDAQIRDYMAERYGAFISYKPPVRPSTWILWFFPPLMLALLMGWWLWRNAQLGHRLQTKLGDGAHTSANNPLAVNTDENGYKDRYQNNMSAQAGQSATVASLSEAEAAALSQLLQRHEADTEANKKADNEANKETNTEAID